MMNVVNVCVCERSAQNKSLKIIDFIGFVVDQSLLFYCYIRTYTAFYVAVVAVFGFARHHMYAPHI